MLYLTLQLLTTLSSNEVKVEEVTSIICCDSTGLNKLQPIIVGFS